MKLSKIIFAVFAFTLSLSATPAHAVGLQGFLLNTAPNEPLRLQLKNSNLGALVIDAPMGVLSLLRQLHTNDFLDLQGSISADNKSVTIETIDRLGLQELLGAWRTDRWEVFEFKNYTHLELFIPYNAEGNSQSAAKLTDETSGLPARTRSLRYVVTPQNNTGLSIFISDENGVRLGFLTLGYRHLTIEMSDLKNGGIAERIQLVPVDNQ